MKKLQNNFTTPEQSKRLLALGVPADSADCFYDILKNNPLEGIPQVRSDKYGNSPRFFEDYCFWPGTIIEKHIPSHKIPCWSVGRLIEICLKCSTLEQRQVRFFCNGDDDEYSLIDYVVTVLESGVMTNHMDFSKLEDYE